MNPKVLLQLRVLKNLLRTLEKAILEDSESTPAEKTVPEVCGASGADLCDDGFCSICVSDWRSLRDTK